MNFFYQSNLRFVAAVITATCLMNLGSISSASAQERIENISQEVFDCMKRNNVNDQGYVTYESNGDMWVGHGRPGDPGGVKLRYSYNQDQGSITLERTGPAFLDLANVLGQARNGISGTADKCRSGELR